MFLILYYCFSVLLLLPVFYFYFVNYSEVLSKDKLQAILINLIRIPVLKQLTLTVSTLLTGIWIFFFYHYNTNIYAWNSLNFYTVSRPYFIVILIVTLVLSIFYAFTSCLQFNQEKLRSKKKLLLQQQSYIYVLEDLQNDIRSFQHDYKNVLTFLYLQAQNGDINGIRDFMKDHIYSFDQNICTPIT